MSMKVLLKREVSEFFILSPAQYQWRQRVPGQCAQGQPVPPEPHDRRHRQTVRGQSGGGASAGEGGPQQDLRVGGTAGAPLRRFPG